MFRRYLGYTRKLRTNRTGLPTPNYVCSKQILSNVTSPPSNTLQLRKYVSVMIVYFRPQTIDFPTPGNNSAGAQCVRVLYYS